MDDSTILQHVSALVDEEHRLREHGTPSSTDAARLKHVQEQLDQCWDLLRQRRALREFGDNPKDARVRPAGTVENYEQ